MAKDLHEMRPAELHAANDRAVQRMVEHVRGRSAMVIELNAAAAWAIVGQLQLALRHPENKGRSSSIARQLADELIRRIADGDVEIDILLRRGDDPSYDSPRPATPEPNPEP